MILERDIEARFLRLVGDSAFVVPLKLNLQGSRGWPDRLLVLPNGRVVWIEFKRHGGRLTRLQQVRHWTLKEKGHEIEVFDDALEAAYFVGYAWRAAMDSARLPKNLRALACKASRSGTISRSRAGKNGDLTDRISSLEKSKGRTTNARRCTPPPRRSGVDPQ